MSLNNLNSLTDFLVDNGIDEGEINYFIHQRRIVLQNRSLMDLIRENNWEQIWTYVRSYISGDYL